MKVAHLPCPVSGFLVVGIRHPKDLFGLLIYKIVLCPLGHENKFRAGGVLPDRNQSRSRPPPVLAIDAWPELSFPLIRGLNYGISPNSKG